MARRIRVGQGFTKHSFEQALSMAHPGDVLLLDEGVYAYERLNIYDNITIKGAGDPKKVVLTGQINAETSFAAVDLTIMAQPYFNAINSNTPNATVILDNVTVYGEESGQYPSIYLAGANLQANNSCIYSNAKDDRIQFGLNSISGSQVNLSNTYCPWIKLNQATITMFNIVTKQIVATDRCRCYSTGSLTFQDNDNKKRWLAISNRSIFNASHIVLGKNCSEAFVKDSLVRIDYLQRNVPYPTNFWVDALAQVEVNRGFTRLIDNETKTPKDNKTITIGPETPFADVADHLLPGDTLQLSEGTYSSPNVRYINFDIEGLGNPDNTIINISTFYVKKRANVSGQQSFKNVTLISEDNINVVYAEKGSDLSLSNVILTSPDDSNIPSLYATDCAITIKNCRFNKVTEHSVCFKNAAVSIEDSTCNFVYCENSTVNVTNSEATILQLTNGSQLNGTVHFTPIGETDYYRIWANNSSINADYISFSDQVFKMSCEESTVAIPSISGPEDSQATLRTFGETHVTVNAGIEVIDGDLELEEAQDNLPKLEDLYGLATVKRQIREFIDMAKARQVLIDQGRQPQVATLHSLFLGNPGTGKTTVARIMARELRRAGVLRTKNYVEVGRQDLVGEHVGETALKTQQVLESALGGVLFIDEAYSLASDSNNEFGKEAVDTILAFMENHRDDILIIFAGYTDKMQEFLRMNPGLPSRIPHTFNFEDYSVDDLVNMGYDQLVNDGYTVDKDAYRRQVTRSYRVSADRSNGRWIRNFNQEIFKIIAPRLVELQPDETLVITDEDLRNVGSGDIETKQKNVDELLEQINSLTGLTKVKEYTRHLVNRVKANQRLEERGLETERTVLHMMFTGNPGTGKTTVARILGKIFYNLGVLSSPTVKEVSRSDLVGQYIGQTEVKTTQAIQEAMGGVLFVDEAYQLASENDPRDFGREAIDTLLTALENQRNQFIAIFAGYTNEMEKFLAMNPGLESRIPLRIEFEDYTPEEVASIAADFLSKSWKFNRDVLDDVVIHQYQQVPPEKRSNARWARIFSEKVINMHKDWIAEESTDDDDIQFILDKTIRSVTM